MSALLTFLGSTKVSRRRWVDLIKGVELEVHLSYKEGCRLDQRGLTFPGIDQLPIDPPTGVERQSHDGPCRCPGQGSE